jgi:aryl-phospho-beta-D-glucosidase BglC (GH1 family)
MRKVLCTKKIIAFIMVVSMLLSLFPVSFVVKAADAADPLSAPGNDDWLHVKGNKIVDKDGREVWLTGTNWFGFNTGSGVFDGVWSCNMKTAFKNMADRGINFLRIPMSVQIINEWAAGIYPKSQVNDFVNPELKGKNSLELFDIAMSNCKEYGIKVMVDIHSAPSAAMGHTIPLWYDGSFTTEDFYKALEWIAKRYKNDDTILAVDLKNEPHGNPNQSAEFAKWDNSKDRNNWKYVAEEAGKKVLAINPNLLIMVEGVEAYPKSGYDYTAKDEWGKESKYYFNWWGGSLRGVKDYPVNLGTGNSQLVYSPHDYGPMVYKQSWFYDGFTKNTLYNDCWKDNWAFINEQNIAPLLIGEWGGFMDGGPNEKWMVALRDYMIENKIHHTFWCYNANSGDTGGLVTHDFITWEEDKYALLKPALWQNKAGKFVGLDHQVPLGSNGISLSEYNEGPIVSISPSTSKPTPSSTPTPTVHTGTTGNKVSGYIKPDFTNTSLKNGFKVEIVGQSLNKLTDSNGYFELGDISTALSSYNIKISKAGYVSRTINNINNSSNASISSQSEPISLFAGDLNGDDNINMSDILLLAKSFNSTKDSSNYNEVCDINADTSINMNDVIIIAKNFNKTSANY